MVVPPNNDLTKVWKHLFSQNTTILASKATLSTSKSLWRGPGPKGLKELKYNNRQILFLIYLVSVQEVFDMKN